MPNICHELIIGAPAETVYRAITTQEGLSAWWTPETNAEQRCGSIARFSFGTNYYKEMEITDLISRELVRWTCVAGAAEWVSTTISFKINEGNRELLLNSYPEAEGQLQQDTSDTGVLVAFKHSSWRAYTPMYAECNYTWGQFLRSLKLMCETGKGRPWPNQHRTGF